LKPVSLDTKQKVFVIEKGDGIETISNNLKKNGLIKEKYSFMAYAYFSGLGRQFKSGNYKFSQSQSAKAIAVKLTQGGTRDYWLKIIDGSRVEEIAALFPDNLNFTQKDFLNKAKSSEGYLFPDSYLIPEYFDIDQILDLINENFAIKFAQAKKGSTNKILSDNEIIVFASLLEREGRTLESKQKIAGILLNRLEIGMPLQVDASVQYARDSKSTKITEYWKPVTSTEIGSIVSPYNTYKNKGIPPKPICSPGYNSLYAAYHPNINDYLYYISDNDGIMHYAKTLDEHNLNIQKYLR
jgi:UPF0755 protein